MSDQLIIPNPFFQRLKERHHLANFRAMRNATRNKFSYYFQTLFKDLGQERNKNLLTWLELVASSFRINVDYVKPFMLQEATSLFQELQLNPEDPRNRNVFHFWLYLNKVYISLFYNGYSGRDNILGFMAGFPFHDTRVVIIGQDPTRSFNSSGFAFHFSPCVSTKMLLKFMSGEMDLVCKMSGGAVPQLPLEQYDKAYKTGELSGWLNQGVLMINCNLTNTKANWGVLINFLIRQLSKKIPNLVFILAGNLAMEKARWVDYKKHVVLRVYHPASYSYEKRNRSNQNGRDWDRVLPFINTNLNLLQKAQLNPESMIDWSQINGKVDRNNNNDRMKQLHQFYVRLLEDPRTQILEPGERYVYYQYTTRTSGGWINNFDIRVVRGRGGGIYLESIKNPQQQ